MKKLRRVFLPIFALAASNAHAQGWYLGASAGLMDNDVSGFDDATNAGVLVGYDIFSKDVFALSLEGELTTTVSDGDLEINGLKGDWDIDTQAAYVAARVGQPIYLKVRFGAARRDVSVDVAGGSASDSDSSLSWSGAVGWMFSKHWGVQLDGTMVEADVNYWNAGVRYQFQ